jgi:pseudaminic acid synthase
MTLTLRRFAGTDEDAALLHRWRNDPLSRRMSLDGREIPWPEHLAWTRRLAADPDRLQLVAVEGGAGVGSVRFDRATSGPAARVALVVAPEARGRGLAAAILKLGIREARRRWPDLRSLQAEIRGENEPSRRAFARAGFREASGAGGVGRWVRPIEPDLDLSGPRPLVVAELSANHGGSLARALDTIAAAAEAGADAVKLQTYTPATMTLQSTRPEFRIAGGPWAGRTLWDLYAEAHTPWEWHPELKAAANRLGMPLFSTPFDGSAVDFLEELEVPAYKVASFEITDVELLARIAATGRPVIASTGMASLAEIDRAVHALRDGWAAAGAGAPALALLKCVSAYPAEPRDMNLRTIPHLGAAFGAVPGLSDHTLGVTTAIAAVALGARLIEKHFTLRRADGGPDAAFSLEPPELRALTSAVRDAAAALGEVRYGPVGADAGNRVFRRSLFFVRPVRAGQRIARGDVRAIRPGHGLPPEALPLIEGRRARCDCEAGEPVAWALLD